MSPVLLPGLFFYAIDSFSLAVAPALAFAFSTFALVPLPLTFALSPLSSSSFVEARVGVATTALARTGLLVVAFAFAIVAHLSSRFALAVAYGRWTQAVRVAQSKTVVAL